MLEQSIRRWALGRALVLVVAATGVLAAGCGASAQDERASAGAAYPSRRSGPAQNQYVTEGQPHAVLKKTANHEDAAAEIAGYAPGIGRAPSPSEAGSYDEAPSRELMPPPAPPPPPQDNDGDGIPDKVDALPDQIAQNDAKPSATPSTSPGTPGLATKPTTEAHDPAFIIYTAHITLAVYQVDKALERVETIARINGGYLFNRTDNEIVIRVPRAKFQAAISDVETTGDVLHRDVRAEDVTDEYTDLEIRIRNARAMRDRLAALLQKADVKNALEIEKELGRVTEELERMEGRLKLLGDKIAYSTITATYSGRGSSILTTSTRLPFPWLTQLGLPGLLQLHEER